MMKRTIFKAGKELRYGYTTGSCATAAAKAAVLMLIQQEKIKKVRIETPKGWDLILDVNNQEWNANRASCSIIKDGGDDIDCTHGMHVYASVIRREEPGISIAGGLGVGIVTREGLGLIVGEAAINRVPKEMMTKEVLEILPADFGVAITISAPEGVELAKRTFNPQLGIKGGISIVGTSGIVEPMSEEAFRDTLSMDLEMNSKEQDLIVFVPGNYGEDFCLERGIEEARIYKTSNFIGYMLDQAMKFKIPRILLVGHIGKFAKLAAGNFHTHNRMSDGRRETITAYAAMAGVQGERLEKIYQSVTTEAMLSILSEKERNEIFPRIAKAIQERVERFCFGQVEVEVLVFSTDQGLLAQTEKVAEWMEESSHEID
jgi:cobalt-precorrin-5B (C1)-methyltransferase